MSAEIVVWRPSGWQPAGRGPEAWDNATPWCARCQRPVESVSAEVKGSFLVAVAGCHGQAHSFSIPIEVWRQARRLEVSKAFGLFTPDYGRGREVKADVFVRGGLRQ